MDVRATVERLGREHVGKSWWADLAEALITEFEPVVAERDRLRRMCDETWTLRANARRNLDDIRTLRSRGLPVADLLDAMCERLSAPPWPGEPARAALDRGTP